MVFRKSSVAHFHRTVIRLWLRSSSRILRLKLSEGQNWRSEGTGAFNFKVFLMLARRLYLLNAVTRRTDNCRFLRGRNAWSSLRKFTLRSSLPFNCGIRAQSQRLSPFKRPPALAIAASMMEISMSFS